MSIIWTACNKVANLYINIYVYNLSKDISEHKTNQKWKYNPI